MGREGCLQLPDRDKYSGERGWAKTPVALRVAATIAAHDQNYNSLPWRWPYELWCTSTAMSRRF